jgi:tRNA G37 N-methylase Trm5
MIKPKDTVVDPGAGIRDFAIKAVQRTRNVIAIGPNQQDFDLLLKNLQTNGCHNVVPLDMGMASKARDEADHLARQDLFFQGRDAHSDTSKAAH